MTASEEDVGHNNYNRVFLVRIILEIVVLDTKSNSLSNVTIFNRGALDEKRDWDGIINYNYFLQQYVRNV